MRPPSHNLEKTEPTQAEAFNALLQRLDPDRDRAGQEYENLRRSLIRYFLKHAPAEAEALTDKTMDRVGRKIIEGVDIRVRVTKYCRGIARNILLEYFRALNRPFIPPSMRAGEELEIREQCMRKCIQRYRTIFDFVSSCMSESESTRMRIAEEMGLKLAGLNSRVHRAREKLRLCLRKCIEKSGESKII
jgi:DNA-directed RNA polymerase specialized sigma24 family protein